MSTKIERLRALQGHLKTEFYSVLPDTEEADYLANRLTELDIEIAELEDAE